MSHLKSSYRSQIDCGRGVFAGLAEFREEFPALTEAFTGVKDEKGLWDVPPCTVMIFCEGDRLKFCLSPQQGGRVAFGVILDPVKGFASIEQALSEGAFEWKAKKGSR